MTIVAVESIPKTTHNRLNEHVSEVLDTFAYGSAEIVKVMYDSTEFSSANSACARFKQVIRTEKRRMEAYLRNGEVYLKKFD